MTKVELECCFVVAFRRLKWLKIGFRKSVVSGNVQIPTKFEAYQFTREYISYKKVRVRITLSVLRKRRPRKVWNFIHFCFTKNQFSYATTHWSLGMIWTGDLCTTRAGNGNNTKAVCLLYLCNLQPIDPVQQFPYNTIVQVWPDDWLFATHWFLIWAKNIGRNVLCLRCC